MIKKHFLDELKCALLMTSLIVPLFFSIFFLLSFLSLQSPIDRIKVNLRAAFTEGELQDDEWPPLALASRIGYNQYNECLIFMATILRGDDVVKTTVSPNILWWWPYGETAWSKCAILRHLVAGPSPPDLSNLLYPYHRYLHGHRVLAGFFLPLFSVSDLRLLLKTVIYVLILTTILKCAIDHLPTSTQRSKTRVLGNQADLYPASMILVAVAFAAFYGLRYFAMSISHAPSDIVLFAFIVYCLYKDLLKIPANNFYAAVTVYACLTSVFEFLIGAAPLGLAVLIGILALQVDVQTGLQRLLVRAVLGTGVYTATIAACFIMKQLLASIVFGASVWSEFYGNLLWRTWGEKGSVSLGQVFSNLLGNISII